MSWTPTGIEPMQQERERERQRERDRGRGQVCLSNKGPSRGINHQLHSPQTPTEGPEHHVMFLFTSHLLPIPNYANLVTGAMQCNQLA